MTEIEKALNHWREEVGKLHSVVDRKDARIAELEAEVATVRNAARTLDASRQEMARPIQEAARQGRAAVATLDSERSANEILTDRVAELEAQNEKLRAALKPFGDFAQEVEQFVRDRANDDGSPIMPINKFRLGDFRTAAALTTKQEGPQP